MEYTLYQTLDLQSRIPKSHYIHTLLYGIMKTSIFFVFSDVFLNLFSQNISYDDFMLEFYLKERLPSVFMNIWTSSPSLGSLRTKASLKLPLEDVIVEKYPPGWGFPCTMVFPSSSIQIERISPNRDFRATFSLLQKVSKRNLITFILIILIY